MSLLDLCIQATISVIVLVDPFLRGVFFRILTENEPEMRARYVRKIMITIAITLGGSALVGEALLKLIGINLGAFGVAGGFVLAVMGFEMLFGGTPSRTQGGEKARQDPAPASAGDQIIVPYAIPFMAGPGAITTVITISVTGEGGQGTIAALVAVAITVALIPVGHLFLANRMNFTEQTMGLLTRFGGLFIATIGIQLALGGVRNFYGF